MSRVFSAIYTIFFFFNSIFFKPLNAAGSSSYKDIPLDFSTDGIYRASPWGVWCKLKTDQFLAWVDFGEGGYLGFWFEMGYYKEEAVYISSSFL